MLSFPRKREPIATSRNMGPRFCGDEMWQLLCRHLGTGRKKIGGKLSRMPGKDLVFQ
jgi:hypothetical protein